MKKIRNDQEGDSDGICLEKGDIIWLQRSFTTGGNDEMRQCLKEQFHSLSLCNTEAV